MSLRRCLPLTALAPLAFAVGLRADEPAKKTEPPATRPPLKTLANPDGEKIKPARNERPSAIPDKDPAAPRPADDPPAEQQSRVADPPPPEVAQLKRLMPEIDLWIDKEKKRVLVGGVICLREGQLEMFACSFRTKKWESIVEANCKSFVVHAALLAIGAQPGGVAKFDPEYKPAHGMKVNVEVAWTDDKGKRQTAKAQDWIRDAKTRQAMQHPWVFAGSSFWVDKNTGRRHYTADDGDLICVSNFPTAMLDIPVESSQDNAVLTFEAFTERIPPKETPVVLILTPVFEKKPGEKTPAGEKPAGEPAAKPKEPPADKSPPPAEKPAEPARK